MATTVSPSAPPSPGTTNEAPIGRRERRKLEVRSRIYSAARELFTKQGFEATTVDEIAAVADVAPATFFNHFQSKQTLLTLMTGELVDHLHAITVESLQGNIIMMMAFDEQDQKVSILDARLE